MEQKTLEVLGKDLTLVKRPNGIHFYAQMTFILPNNQKTGAITFSSSETNKNKARKDIEDKIDIYVENGTYLEIAGLGNTDNPLFKDFYEVWYKAKFDITYPHHRTREEVQYKVNYLIKDLGNIPLKDFDYAFIEKNVYFKLRNFDVRSGKERKNPLKWETIKKYMVILDKIFRYAKKLKILTINPIPEFVDDIPPVEKQTVSDDEEITTFEDNEVSIILEEAFKVNFQWGLFVTLAVHTGLRRGELIALDINTSFKMNENKIKVNKSISSSKAERLKVGKPKNKKPRAMYFDDELKQLLQKQIDTRKEYIEQQKDTITWRETNPLFLPETKNKQGEPYAPHSISQKWTNFINEVHEKYPFVQIHNFHALRHTFATKLLSEGASIEDVSMALGHSEISITQRRYAKGNNERLKVVPKLLNYNLPKGVLSNEV